MLKETFAENSCIIAIFDEKSRGVRDDFLEKAT